MVIASTRRSFALAAILANALVRTASAGFKAECFSRSDCTGPVLVNGDGNCSMPLREALDGRDPTYPLVPGYPSAYYRGPTIGGILREDVCDSRESVVSAAEAIQYCFDIGAKSSCESKPKGCDCMQNPMSWGETHFRSYGGEDFDFHGVCDLVLFSAPEMNTTIHVRTEQKFEYSYISNAAILINGDILEIGGWGKVIWNGIEDWDLPPTLGGYPLAVKHINRKNTVFTIDVGHGQQIRFKAYKSMVASLNDAQHTLKNPPKWKSFLGSSNYYLFYDYERFPYMCLHSPDGEALPVTAIAWKHVCI
ncbi:expressed unknown protein [Seminavis robusta]|uniref:Uncharacterized protein n=1 Tax=Seminavis robusta TaxID=568900 RepID=A0A9N8E6Y0_9STRA|nr:expressed unknown protein [Seminavis robusta]|eukprot:Sro688_g187360.1 n/a (307) ;mRNA; f:20771-22250